MQSWLAKWTLAWRDLAAQGRRTLFFALLVAAGVASLVGVQGVAGSLAGSMERSARQMVQGDLVISHAEPVTEAQQAALDALEAEGAQVTPVWQSIGMAFAGERSLMVEVKVVDPALWPFYGGFASSPAGYKLGQGEALVGPELLARLGLMVGDYIEVGESRLRIAGTVLAEPRSLESAIPIGPRVLVAHDSFRAPTAADVQTLLVKLPGALTAEVAKAQLDAQFPGADAVTTYAEAWRSFANVMDRVFTFLSMVALISLLVGGLGVGMAMRTFIRQKLEQIAVLKALGATNATIMTIYLIEAALLGLGGSVVGVGLGLGVQLLLPKLLADLIPVATDGLNWAAAASGLLAGLVIALLCALVPVRAVRTVKPVALFRGESVGRMGWRGWLEALLLGALTLGGVAWVAMLYAKSTTVGLGFIGGLLGAGALLFLLAWVLLRLTRLLPQSGRPTIRHAVRSLRAPGNQSTAVVVAMGLGIMLMTTLYLLQHSLTAQVREAGAGPETPNLYIFAATTTERTAMTTFLAGHPQVAKVPEALSVLTAPIRAIDGKPTAELTLPAEAAHPVPLVSGSKEIPHGMKLVAGSWFTPADEGRPLLTVKEEVAKSYGLAVGSRIELELEGQPVIFTVASIIAPSGEGVVTTNMGLFTTAPGALDPYSQEYMVTAVTRPGQEEVVVKDLLGQFPSSMPVSLGALMNLLEEVLAKVANILRFVTGFAVAAAGVILSGSLSATQLRRRKEAALLKALGASRGTVATASALENGLLGAVAGLAGAGLSYGLLQAVAAALKVSIGAGLLPLLAATLAGAALAVLVGLASTVDALQVKPLGILRSE